MKDLLKLVGLTAHANPILPNGGTHELQERYASDILALIRKRLATVDSVVFSTDYEGDPKAGAVKVPVRDSEVVVGDYNILTGVTLTQSATEYLIITLDNDKAINELIDGFEASAVPDNIVAQRINSGAYSLYLTIDTDAITTLETEGTTSSNTVAITVAANNAYEFFMTEQLALDTADIPRFGERFAIVSPTFLSAIKQDENFQSPASDAVFNGIKLNGLVGIVDGVPLIMSNNMASDSEFILGNRTWCQRVMEWKIDPYLADLSNTSTHVGASALKARKIYKHIVTRTTAVRVKTFV